jgi:hypothetical protein
MTVVLNQALTDALMAFGGSNPTSNPAYNELLSAINSSDTLANLLNNDFSPTGLGAIPTLTRFLSTTPNGGEGAFYNNGAIVLPELTSGALQTTSPFVLAFQLGHEQTHANDAASVAAADNTFQSDVQSVMLGGSSLSLDDLVTQDAQAHFNDEAMAQINGFNSLVSAVSAANPDDSGMATLAPSAATTPDDSLIAKLPTTPVPGTVSATPPPAAP